MKEIGQVGPLNTSMGGGITMAEKDKTPDLIRKLISLKLDLYFDLSQQLFYSCRS